MVGNGPETGEAAHDSAAEPIAASAALPPHCVVGRAQAAKHGRTEDDEQDADAERNKRGSASVSSHAPIGTPTIPAAIIGQMRRQLMDFQMRGSVCDCATQEQQTISGATTAAGRHAARCRWRSAPCRSRPAPRRKPPSSAPRR